MLDLDSKTTGPQPSRTAMWAALQEIATACEAELSRRREQREYDPPSERAINKILRRAEYGLLRG
jgi:hypothetical protein